MIKKSLKTKYDEKIIMANVLIFISLIVFLSFINVGFAIYNKSLFINGTVAVKAQGKFSITNVSLIESSNVRSGSIPSYTDTSIDFNLVFEKGEGSTSQTFMAKYLVNIENNSFFSYDCDFSGYVPIIKDSTGKIVDISLLSYEITGLEVGESIPAGESKTVYIIITFNPEDENETYEVEGEIEPEIIEKPNGTILASLPSGAECNLTEGHNIASIDLSLISSFRVDKTANISINNPNFILVDSEGNPVSSIVVTSQSEESKILYIKLADGAIFSTDSITTGITLTYSETMMVNCGSITFLVDIDESFIDTTPPIISNVIAEIQNATSEDTSNDQVGSIKLTWNVDDEAVDHYTVMIYSVSGTIETLLNQYNTNNKYYTFTDLADGNYVFKVYGTDNSERLNTASQTDINNATTSPGYCSKSASSNYDWHYDVTTHLTNVTESNSVKKVNRGYNFTTTVTKNADSSGTCGATTTYKLPNDITVTMDSKTISKGSAQGQYQYTGSSSVSSGDITVYGVTGDLDITVKGTSS